MNTVGDGQSVTLKHVIFHLLITIKHWLKLGVMLFGILILSYRPIGNVETPNLMNMCTLEASIAVTFPSYKCVCNSIEITLFQILSSYYTVLDDWEDLWCLSWQQRIMSRIYI